MRSEVPMPMLRISCCRSTFFGHWQTSVHTYRSTQHATLRNRTSGIGLSLAISFRFVVIYGREPLAP